MDDVHYFLTNVIRNVTKIYLIKILEIHDKTMSFQYFYNQNQLYEILFI